MRRDARARGKATKTSRSSRTSSGFALCAGLQLSPFPGRRRAALSGERLRRPAGSSHDVAASLHGPAEVRHRADSRRARVGPLQRADAQYLRPRLPGTGGGWCGRVEGDLAPRVAARQQPAPRALDPPIDRRRGAGAARSLPGAHRDAARAAHGRARGRGGARVVAVRGVAAAAPPPPSAARRIASWSPPWQFGGGPAVALAPLSPFLRCSSPTALPLDLGAAAPSGPPPS